MRNIFNKLLFCGAFAVSGVAFAGNELDGIYQCNTTVPSVGTLSSYIAVLTNAQGFTGFAVLNPAPGTQSYGYGAGTATSTSFTGTDMNGKAFSFIVSGNTIAGASFVSVNGVSLAATSSCSKVW